MNHALFVFALGIVFSYPTTATASEPSIEFQALSQRCASNVAPSTMAALVTVESSHNPYAIGVVGGRLARQPSTRAEAITTALQLEKQGKNFSMGMAQVNRHNLGPYKVTYEQIFDPCTNLRVGAQILEDCYRRALPLQRSQQAAVRAALSCYYSGNFSRGFRPDNAGQPSYVEKVVAAALPKIQQPVVPAIERESTLEISDAMPVVVTRSVDIDRVMADVAKWTENQDLPTKEGEAPAPMRPAALVF